MKSEKYSFDDLLDIMKVLRGDNGCPWDRVQTHETLKKYFIEETYEVLDAIDLKDKDKLCEELGDVLLQVIFHSRIASDDGAFDISDVIDGISRKMISRHTHVFGNTKADTPDEVVASWEKIKKKEKGKEDATGLLKDVPKSLPALMRSYKVQKLAADVGFDWDDIGDVFRKVREETDELAEVSGSGDMERITDELGDLLFAAVNLARFLKVQPEMALTGTIEKFIDRFEYVEKKAREKGHRTEEMSLAELDAFWEEAKEALPKETNKG